MEIREITEDQVLAKAMQLQLPVTERSGSARDNGKIGGALDWLLSKEAITDADAEDIRGLALPRAAYEIAMIALALENEIVITADVLATVKEGGASYYESLPSDTNFENIIEKGPRGSTPFKPGPINVGGKPDDFGDFGDLDMDYKP